jgi:hypothetical protein
MGAMDHLKEVDKGTLINRLNFHRFVNTPIQIKWRHPENESYENLDQVYLEDCRDGEITCRLREDFWKLELQAYKFEITVDEGRNVIKIPVELKCIDQNRLLRLNLPEYGYSLTRRRAERYPGHDVAVRLIQKNVVANGQLVDFNAWGLRFKFEKSPHFRFDSFDPDEEIFTALDLGQQRVFSGACKWVRVQHNDRHTDVVLAPQDETASIYSNRPFRNPRCNLIPPPFISFDHPIAGTELNLPVQDISTSGFSLHEEKSHSMMVPGLILPELKLGPMGGKEITCSAKVVYRRQLEADTVKCGLGILDMDIQAFKYLSHMLANARDSHAHVSRKIDDGALWKLFFYSGFIYPNKFQTILSNRERCKKTFSKIYHDQSEVSAHFTYQRNREIYGHISMVRAFERTWMIHHLAARNARSKRPGFELLKEIIFFIHDLYRLPSAKVDYVMCYFRPENRFPKLAFGDFARSLNDSKICSLDLFCYTANVEPNFSAFPEKWTLMPCSRKDIDELNTFYRDHSNGLLLDAFGISVPKMSTDSLEKAYESSGLLREIRWYSLKIDGILVAVLMVNKSEPGLNFSELLNCIQAFVINYEFLPWECLSQAVFQLIERYGMHRVPTLVYPSSYATTKGVAYEKSYQLFILDVRNLDEYMQFLSRKFRVHFE